MIVKRSGGYHVVSESGKNLGGPYKSRKAARRRLRQVEYFKHRGKSASLSQWAEGIMQECLTAAGADTDAGLLAGEILVSTLPMPDEVEIEQDEGDENGNDPVPVDVIDAFFAHDIFNRQAQGILNRSLQAARGLSTAARKELAAALKSTTNVGGAIINFVDKYRVQLAKILTQTQIACVLEGAKEVADKVPTLAEFPGAIPPPPTIEPQEAVKLVEKLEKLDPDVRAEEVYKLPAAEQAYVNQAIAARAALPVVPPVIPQRVGGGEPEDIHFLIIDEAVRSLAERNVIDRQKYDALEASARAKAFTVANVQAEETLTKIRDSLADNVREGADYETWSDKVLEDVGQGTFMSDAHQETVFRTNVQSGFADGQETILSHPLVRSGFPYRARDAIHDDRVRANHLALETLGIQGTNIYRADDPVWRMFRAPWDYNDRCSDTPITVRQAAERGIREAQEWLETGVEPATKAFVKMPDFRPPPGFQRAVASVPLSVQMSMQPMATFSTAKPEEETDTSVLYGSPEVGSIGSATLDTAREGKARIKVGRAKTAKGKRLRRSLFKKLRVKKKWNPNVPLSVDAEGHQHKGKGPGGGQFTSTGGSGETPKTESESYVPPPKEDTGNIPNVTTKYIEDAKNMARSYGVQVRVDRVAYKLERDDKRWAPLQKKIAGRSNQLAKLEEAHKTEVEKLSKMTDEQVEALKAGSGNPHPGGVFTAQAEKCDEALGKFLKFRREMDDKALNDIKKHVGSKDTIFETGSAPIKEVRLQHNTGGDWTNNLSDQQKAAVADAEKLLSGRISSLLKQRVDETDVRSIPLDKEQRDHFKGTRHGGDAQSIYLSNTRSENTVIHEFGHSLETNANIHAAAQGFLYMRCRDEECKRMGEGFRDYEVGRDDEFGSAFGGNSRYVGKHYMTDDTEVISMGMEMLFSQPTKFAASDPQYFKFMIGIIDGTFA